MAKADNVMTTGDVAKICNVAHRTVSKWIESGLLNAYLIPGGRDRRITIIELNRFMQAHNMPIPENFAMLIKEKIDDNSENNS